MDTLPRSSLGVWHLHNLPDWPHVVRLLRIPEEGYGVSDRCLIAGTCTVLVPGPDTVSVDATDELFIDRPWHIWDVRIRRKRRWLGQ